MKKINKTILAVTTLLAIACAQGAQEKDVPQAQEGASVTKAGIVMPKIDRKKKIKELQNRITEIETKIDSTTVDAAINKERLRRERDMLKRQRDNLIQRRN